MARWAAMRFTATVAVGLGIALPLPASASPIPVGERCDAVSYAWSGSAVVGGDVPSVAIDLEVPVAVPGETVRVTAVQVDAGAVVSVGGVAVDGGGDEIAGGAVWLHHDGDAVEVTSLTLEVARCAQVAQAPPPSTLRGISRPVQRPAVPARAEGSAGELSRTGAPTLALALGALGCLLVGSALVAGVRRPA